MKNINKVLAIVLTLALLAGSVFIAMPASAADNSWSSYNVPTLYTGTGASIYAFTGDGSTIYLLQNGGGTVSQLYKSTDGGGSFSNGNLDTNLTLTTAGTILALKVDPADPTILIANTATKLYRSQNSGQTWSVFFDPTTTVTPAGTKVNSIDIADNSGAVYAVGTDKGMYIYDSANSGMWVLAAGSTPNTPVTGTIAAGTGVLAAYTAPTTASTITYTVTTAGNFTVTLPVGVSGVATTGTSVVTGSPAALVAGGVTTITLTGLGNFTIALSTPIDGTNLATSAVAATINFDSVALAPNYATSQEVFVVDGPSGGPYYFDTFIAGTGTGTGWNIATTTTSIGPETGTVVTNIALPSDIDTGYRVYKAFVGIGNDVWRIRGTGSSGSFAVATAQEIGTAGGLSLGGVNSMDYNGTSTAGTLVVGEKNISPTGDAYAVTNSTNMWTTTAASVTWSPLAGDMPSVSGNANANVQFQPGISTTPVVYVGTNGPESGLFKSNTATLDSFWGVGFYHISSLAASPATTAGGGAYATGDNVRFGKRTFRFIGYSNMQCVLMDQLDKSSRLLLTSDNGKGVTWNQILWNPNAGSSKSTNPGIWDVNQFGTTWIADQGLGSTSYDTFGDTYYNRYYFKSIDNGITWSKLNMIAGTAGNTITVFSPIDANTYWLGGSNGLKMNTDLAWTTIGTAAEPVFNFWNSTDSNGGNWRFIQTTLGNGYLSTDMGVTWKQIAGNGDFSIDTRTNPITVDPLNRIIYVWTTTQLKSWEIDTSTAWKVELNLSDLPPALNAAMDTSVAPAVLIRPNFEGVGEDGFYYFSSLDNTVAQIWRSQDLKGVDFAPMKGTDYASAGGAMNTIRINYDVPGQTLFKCNILQSAFSGTDQYTYAQKAFNYTQDFAGKITSPAANASVNSPVTLQWNQSPEANTDYQLTVAYDPGMTSTVAGYNQLNCTTNLLPNQAFLAGTYYMQVRAYIPFTIGTTQYATYSLWSAPQQFTVKTVGIINNAGIGNADSLYPPQGSVNVSTTPVLTWGVVANATYSIKIATDSAFTNIVDSKDGLTVALYTPAMTLDQNKTYYWEVQAISGGIASDWVAFAFTTGGPAVATTAPVTAAPTPIITVINPTPIVTVTIPPTTPVAPATPAYIWFIIVIGAVLVIAVIVLIVRTRRV